jgi:SOS-response transcriptional repressor LexA
LPDNTQVGVLIARARAEQNLTQGQVASYASAGAHTKEHRVTRSWLSLVEKGIIKRPDRDKLERIAPIIQVDVADLLSAAGHRVGALARPTGERSVDDVLSELRMLLRARESRVALAPVVSSRASAGAGTHAEPEVVAYPLRPGEQGHMFLAVRVSGLCMEPRVRDGDLVVFDCTAAEQTPVSDLVGRIVVAEHDGDHLVKRLAQDAGVYVLAPDNPAAGRGPLRVNGGTRIVGVAVFAGSYL